MRNLERIKNRQRGELVSATLGLLVFITVTMFIMLGWSETSFRMDKTRLLGQVNEINSGADTWKGFRSNYTGLTMAIICAAGQQSVSETTCGGVGGSGSSSNAFGGNFVLTPATNVSQKQLNITGLPAERINELADSLAPVSANQCASRTGCATVTISGTSITVTM
ncbi:hypothetical protein [Enterovibrio norvegicus]|uniref:hypothetical protein n=1 Tax=Enterovibrio norvegicus TaxID=188144 RepID=UPI000C839952|nr:hypothetical protein [Enterovibrio norvegicus]PMH64440.1 hypothetical protein BCU62_15410 [Enterovibrio norvegicus]